MVKALPMALNFMSDADIPGTIELLKQIIERYERNA